MTREEREQQLRDEYERDMQERAAYFAELERRYPDSPPESEASRERNRRHLAIVGEEWDRYITSLTQADYDEYFAAHPHETCVEGVEALFENAKEREMNERIVARTRAEGLDWYTPGLVTA